jgi:myo-inositol-1(or 4)-monophosphatase
VSEAYRVHREVAERAAAAAGAVLLGAYGTVAAREKAPFDLVTDADGASQATIAAALAEAFPDHTLLAEEDGVVPDPGVPWRWIVDPLDGTINFAHGFPLWCVSIALEHEGRLVVGVVHVPLTGTTYSAALGLGATRDGRPLRVSAVERLGAALIVAGMPTAFAADAARQLAYFGRFSTETHSVRRTGTLAWNLALVAAGGCDIGYATAVHPWDAAAGVVLIREAGGTVTDLAGEPYDLYRGDILATNGRVHAEAVRALADSWPGAREPAGGA